MIVMRMNQPPFRTSPVAASRRASARLGDLGRGRLGGARSSDRLLLTEPPDVPDHDRDHGEEQDDRDRGAPAVVSSWKNHRIIRSAITTVPFFSAFAGCTKTMSKTFIALMTM